MQKEKKIYHYQLFAGVEHGFALRGDPEDPYQRKLINQRSSIPLLIVPLRLGEGTESTRDRRVVQLLALAMKTKKNISLPYIEHHIFIIMEHIGIQHLLPMTEHRMCNIKLP